MVFIFLFLFYLFAWLVGWLEPGSTVGMVWYGIGKCIAGFVVYFYYSFLSKLRVVSYLSYLYFICLFFLLLFPLYELLVVVVEDGSESDHIISYLLDLL